MKQLIGGIAGALITGIAVFGWTGSSARDEASWSAAETQRPLQLVSDQRGTPAAVMDSESAPALNVTCEPGQRAVIRRMPSVAGMSIEAGCVGGDDIATLSNVQGLRARAADAAGTCRARGVLAASRAADAVGA